MQMPPVGLGTFRLKGQAVQQPLRDAIRLGYRHIDTAAIYRNEEEIGDVLQDLYQEGSVARYDLWITSKLSPYDMKTPRASLLKSLSLLQTEYLDLYLIHWPAMARKHVTSPLNKKLRLEAWKVLSEAKQEGLVRNIGASNFTPNHIRELRDETVYGIEGIFLQMEIHPWYWRDALEIQTHFRVHNITMTGYALLAEGKVMAEDCPEVLDQIEARTGISKVQVVLAWALSKNWGVLVKSENERHLKQNLVTFTLASKLTTEDYMAIDDMSTLASEEKRCWDPRAVI